MTGKTMRPRSGFPGLAIVLSPDEYRLALLGTVDFAGAWAALEAATAYVVDGPNKGRLVRDRLAPISGQLVALLDREVDAVEMLTCRHWFRNSALQSPRPVGTGSLPKGEASTSVSDTPVRFSSNTDPAANGGEADVQHADLRKETA